MASADEATGPLILVVDDETHVLNEVAATLVKGGYACHCCLTVESAVRYTQSSTPNLIISDINLGGQSGLEMCERIKEATAPSPVSVMFLSGSQIPDIIRRSHSVGGAYYLRKPFDPNVLLELVAKAMETRPLVSHHAE